VSDIKAIFFDLDGVLVDACDWHYHALNEALKKVCGFTISRKDHESTYNGLSTLTKLDLLNLNEEEKKLVWSTKQELTIATIEKHAKEDLDKKSLLKDLKDRGIKIFCVTNSIRLTTETMLEYTGQLPLIDRIITNEDVINNKPYPDCYNLALSISGERQESCIIVEDSDKGYQAAQDSNVSSIWRVLNAKEVTIKNLNKFLLKNRSE